MTPSASIKITQLLFMFTISPSSLVYSFPKLPTTREPSLMVAHSSFMPLSTEPSPSDKTCLFQCSTKKCQTLEADGEEGIHAPAHAASRTQCCVQDVGACAIIEIQSPAWTGRHVVSCPALNTKPEQILRHDGNSREKLLRYDSPNSMHGANFVPVRTSSHQSKRVKAWPSPHIQRLPSQRCHISSGANSDTPPYRSSFRPLLATKSLLPEWV